MTNKEILEKAVNKAIENGWDVDLEVVLPELQKKWSLYGLRYTGHSGILFSRDFAKALWGTSDDKIYEVCGKDHEVDGECYDYDCRNYDYRDGWQYHLQQMVIADDPIKYLGDNLDY